MLDPKKRVGTEKQKTREIQKLTENYCEEGLIAVSTKVEKGKSAAARLKPRSGGREINWREGLFVSCWGLQTRGITSLDRKKLKGAHR